MALLLAGCTPAKNGIAVSPTEIDKTDLPTMSPLGTVEFPSATFVPTQHYQALITPHPVMPVRSLTVIPTQTETIKIMCPPLGDETISSVFDIVSNPFDPPLPGRDDHHHGVDFAYYRRGDRLSIEGEQVNSILPGNIAAVINDRLPYGNMVIVETSFSLLPRAIVDGFEIPAEDSLYSLYAHMGKLANIKLGEAISCGEELGNVGATGYKIVNPHLHLETRIGTPGIQFTSMAFYDTTATKEERDNYLRWRTSEEFRLIDPLSVFASFLSNYPVINKTPTP